MSTRSFAAPVLPTVTMVGGGQLARMTHQAAIALGQRLRVLAESPDDPAAQVSPDIVVGSHTDLRALRRAARGCHVLTFDHEHVPTEHLLALQGEGVRIAPPPEALRCAQDKLVMRRRLRELGVAVPDFTAVSDVAQAVDFGETAGWPVVLKAVRGGYDGRGVWVLDDGAAAEKIVTEQLEAGTALLVETKIELRRELSAVIARSPFGQAAAWPVVQTIQRAGQCAVVLAPAPEISDEVATEAESLALGLAAELGVVGVMAVELFQATTGELLVNELAMRPHNSGHWTMDGAVTSQFEQHLRAVLDYPLGDTSPLAPVTVMANVLGAENPPEICLDERLHHLFARMPDARVHLYGKSERPHRKIGHVNVLGAEVSIVAERAERAAHWLSHAVWTDGWDPHHG